MNYGELPFIIDNIKVDCEEMMFYQYLPIKMVDSDIRIPEQLLYFDNLIDTCIDDFINEFGMEQLDESYIYLTAKKSYQDVNTTYNRFGYHSDGFLTDDINYIWSDMYGTIFNNSKFNLTLDDELSLKEMNDQAAIDNEIQYNDYDLIRLNQYNIHRVCSIMKPCFRTFFKLSFSTDKYDLKGNSHNYMFDYDWEMRDRKLERNIPQKL